MPTKYFSQNQAAEYLDVHRNTLVNMRKAGRLQPQIEQAGNLALYSQEYLNEKKAEIAARGETRGAKKKAKG